MTGVVQKSLLSLAEPRTPKTTRSSEGVFLHWVYEGFFKFWSHCFCMLNEFQIPQWPVRTPNQEGLLWHESYVFPSSRLVSCSHPVHVFVARRCSAQGTCVGLSVGCDVSITGSFPPHPLLFHRELAALVDSTWQIVLCTLAVIIRTLWWVDQEEKQSVWTAMTWVLTVPFLVSGRVDSGPAQWFQTIFAKKLCYPHLEAVLLSYVEWTMATWVSYLLRTSLFLVPLLQCSLSNTHRWVWLHWP